MGLFVLAMILAASAAAPRTTARQTPAAQRTADAARAKYFGRRTAGTLPAGVRQRGAYMIGSKAGLDTPMDFAIREVSAGKVKMLWLERVAERDARGVSEWEVIDVLVLPRLRRNQVLATTWCFVGKEYEPEVLAVFDYEDRQYFTRARRAWRANRATGRFEPMPTRGVRCENEGWGV